MSRCRDIEVCFSIREDKFDDIRTLYSSIRMKESAGVACEWEIMLTNLFQLSKDHGNFFYVYVDIKRRFSHRLPNLCEVTQAAVGDYPERYLTRIAPFLEDGFIEIKERNLHSGKHINVYGLAVKNGKLYNTVKRDDPTKQDNTMDKREVKVDLGCDYMLICPITFHYNEDHEWVNTGIVVSDDNYLRMFTY